MSMTIIKNTTNTIIKKLTEHYNGQLAVTATPYTEQEKMTRSV